MKTPIENDSAGVKREGTEHGTYRYRYRYAKLATPEQIEAWKLINGDV